ncbi:Up-regulated during septation-domain-containing protein [Podospora didyma]|uniref:Up-regulated during septation-domain-containing protein n=1 Tax=Podospora didyma TaxID=330526 RepID=A0AAE0U1N6_9PEZI|nr:Up-regulated during septation-domain-containing protein [Podospora didyma]
MNGAATRKGGDGFSSTAGGRFPAPAVQPPPPRIGPSGKALVEGYRKDIITGFEPERPRYNPLNTTRTQSSALVDLKDPIQVHLLTETALSDSKTFEILSQEEVDDLKKQIQSLTMRVEQARTNLAIQSKYRDAAISMARLYSPTKPEGKRRSLLGNRVTDSVRDAEVERQASERRCEELATELFTLEKRLVEPQRRLLQHTAGILQMTHRAKTKKAGQTQPMLNGIPGSPESLYTYSNARNSMEFPTDDTDFDDRSLYLPLDQMDGQFGRPRKNTLEIPIKSPVRENNQLRGEMDRIKAEVVRLQAVEQQLRDENSRLIRAEEELQDENIRLKTVEKQLTEGNSQSGTVEEQLKDENTRLRAAEEQLGTEAEELREQNSGRLRTIADMEQKLEILNSRLREVVVTFNPAKNGGYAVPGIAVGSGETLKNQVEYLQRGLATVLQEQKLFLTDASKETEKVGDAAAAAAVAATNAAALSLAEARIVALSRQVGNMLQRSNLSQPSSDKTLNGQLDSIENALEMIGSELSRAAELSSSTSNNRQNIEQVDAILMGLWDIIQTGYAEIQERKTSRRKTRSEQGLADDDEHEDMFGDEIGNLNEPYTLQSFSTKVQWLYAQATSLREQKSVLKRQIKQQRELNNKTGSEKDQELRAKTDELENTRILLNDSERAASEAMEKLAKALDDMDTLQKTSLANESATASSSRSVQEQLKERNSAIAALETSNQEVQTRLADAETSLSSLKTQLNQAAEARAVAEASAEKLLNDIKEKDEELDRMNVMVIELKTELTFAKAELDGAYGSRKQRAAEVAALSKTSESVELNAQIAKLRTELENTLKDLEDITKESITAEKEKLDLESKLDDALAAKTNQDAEIKALRDRLDTEVARLKEQLDAERLKVPVGSPAGGAGGSAGSSSRAGATMLSEQFRATMKEERKKFQEELREEQAKRRKMEDELRALRRGQQGLSRSSNLGGSLSPR